MGDGVEFKLGEISGKLDALLGRTDRIDAAHTKAIGEHDNRIGKLEQSRAYLLGAGAACGALAGWLGDLLLHLIK